MNGLLAGFAGQQELLTALARLRAAKIEAIETYTPVPLEAVEASAPAPLENEASGSPLPLAMFVAGMSGFVGFFLLMTYADVVAYPLDIGGRPPFAWPTFVPIAFELGVLCAMGTGFFGYLVICRLPHLYDPVDECEDFRRASRDGWFLAIRASDPERVARARGIVEALHPASIEEFRA